MAAVKLSDEALLAFFQSHPSFRDRLASIVGAVGNLDGDLGEADAAEERLVEEMRHLGRHMFGKTGVFCDAVMFGMVTENTFISELMIRAGQFPGSQGLSASQLRKKGSTIDLEIGACRIGCSTNPMSSSTGREQRWRRRGGSRRRESGRRQIEGQSLGMR